MDLSKMKGLSGDLDLSGVPYANCTGMDLTKVNIVGWPHSIDLTAAILPAKLDLSAAISVRMEDCDFSKTQVLGLPKEFLSISRSKGFSGKFDFSKMDGFIASAGADLDKVVFLGYPKKQFDIGDSRNFQGNNGVFEIPQIDTVFVGAFTRFDKLKKVIDSAHSHNPSVSDEEYQKHNTNFWKQRGVEVEFKEFEKSAKFRQVAGVLDKNHLRPANTVVPKQRVK